MYFLISLSGSRIHPLEFELMVRQRHLLVKAVSPLLLVWDVHGDGTAAEEHPHVAVLCSYRGREGGKARSPVKEREKDKVTLVLTSVPSPSQAFTAFFTNFITKMILCQQEHNLLKYFFKFHPSNANLKTADAAGSLETSQLNT